MVLNGINSEWERLYSGIPQGSVLKVSPDITKQAIGVLFSSKNKKGMHDNITFFSID